MGDQSSEKISGTAAERKLRRLDNKTSIVTLWSRLQCPVEVAASSSLAHSGRTKSGLPLGQRSGHAIEAQHPGGAAHGGDAESNMGVEFEPKFLRPLADVFALYITRKCLIFHLLTHTRYVYIEDRFGRLDERYCGQKTGQLIARKEGFGEVRFSRYTGVLCMTHDGFANLLRPSLIRENFVSNEGMFLRAGVFFVIK